MWQLDFCLTISPVSKFNLCWEKWLKSWKASKSLYYHLIEILTWFNKLLATHSVSHVSWDLLCVCDHLLRSHTRTEFPAAAYRTVPLGLRAIWLIWFSPAGMVTVRLVLDAQASPTLTWPEDLRTTSMKHGWLCCSCLNGVTVMESELILLIRNLKLCCSFTETLDLNFYIFPSFNVRWSFTTWKVIQYSTKGCIHVIIAIRSQNGKGVMCSVAFYGESQSTENVTLTLESGCT